MTQGLPRRPEEDLVASVLAAARAQLGMEVAYFSEFVEPVQVIRGAAGETSSFGLEAGVTVPLADSYCQRMIDGALASLVPDVRAEPLVADLPATAEIGIGAYVGVPLVMPDGQLYGTLCCASHQSRCELTERDVQFLRVLAQVLAQHLRHESERAAWTAALERANAELDEFAHVVAHDLTEPMRTVSGLVRLLERRHGAALGEEGREEVELIVGEARRMEQLVDDVLAYARAGAELRRTETDLGALAREVVGALAGTLEAAGARVELGELPSVRVAPTALRQVLQNLIANAVRHRGERAPVVALAAERTDGGWRLTVTDNGPGIDPRDRERIFAPFVRGRDAAGRPGSGIGLAVCAKLVAAHGGELAVEPAAGGGSVFAFVLPDG